MLEMRGDGRVFLRGVTWWIAYYGPKDGEWGQIRESSQSERREVAEQLLKRRTREVANHRDGIKPFASPKHQRLTVGDLLDALKDRYREKSIKSMASTLNHLKHVREYFGDRLAARVTAETIRNFRTEQKAAGLANATINRRLEILAAAYALAVDEERIFRRPHVEYLPESNARKGFFEPEELQLILPHLRYPLDEMTRFAYVCGWRQGECKKLRWEMVDRSAGEVRLPDSKNGEGRSLPIAGDLVALFDRLWSARQFMTKKGPALSEYVFHRNGHPLSSWAIGQDWGRARTVAGLPTRIFHDLRRTAVRNLVRAGVDQSVAMKITGHVTDSVFRRYNIVSTTDQAAALERQTDYLNGRSSNVRSIAGKGGNAATKGTKRGTTK